MRRVLPLLAAVLVAACAAPPEAASPETSAAAPEPTAGIGTLAPVFRDYRIGTRRPGGEACSPSGGALRYVASLEYLDSPPVVFGLDAAGCVAEIRAGVGAGLFEHAVALATQRLGPPDGEDRATCVATGTPLQCLFWERSEGRFEVVRAGVQGEAEFVLRPAGAPPGFSRLCDGEVRR
ncbi:MAG TPA: hypothetical protein VK002_10025 [Rubricoccaceae bacterium]|nr:hypothetical protein [Rubricoccaceae bacterium]